MGKTSISWTDVTWNPIRGCSRISEGCRNCYAERIAARFSKPGQPFHSFAQVVAPRDHMDAVGGRRNGWTRKVEFQPDQLAIPLRWRKGRRIFCSSMTDIFHESLTNEQIAAMFGVMAACPQHTFQVLTKRAKRMREWFAWADDATARSEWMADPRRPNHAPAVLKVIEWLARLGPIDLPFQERVSPMWPLPNVWLGVSVENQAAADERIPELLATPAAVRFLSCEPLLGEVRLQQWLARESGLALIGAPPGLKWIIVGCESGPGARPCDVAWLRSLRDQCRVAGVPYFLKQARHLVEAGNYFRVGNDWIDAVSAGTGSKRKPGGVIELPYLDGKQHAAFPTTSAAPSSSADHAAAHGDRP